MKFDTLFGEANSVEANVPKEDLGKVFIVKDTKTNKYEVFESVATFIQNRGKLPDDGKDRFYEDEVIFGVRKQKLKFDIDAEQALLEPFDDIIDIDLRIVNEINIDNKRKHILAEIIETIAEQFYSYYGKILEDDNFVIIVSDDPRNEKFSVHILINNFYVDNNGEAMAFTDIISSNIRPQIKQFIDWSVNKKTQNFRLPGSCKYGDEHRTARIVSCKHTFADGIVTNISGESLPSLTKLKPNAGLQFVGDINGAIFEKILEVAEPIAEQNKSRYRMHKGGMISYDRYESAYCDICGRNHDSDNTFMVIFSRVGEDRFNIRRRCRRQRAADASIEIATIEVANLKDVPRIDEENNDIENPQVTKWSENRIVDLIGGDQTNCLDEVASLCDTYHVYNCSSMLPYEHINNLGDQSGLKAANALSCKTLVVQAPMKIGKTNALKTYISEHFKANDISGEPHIVFTSFRQTFAANIKERFPDFTLYSEVLGALNQNKLIVQVESLMRIPMMVGQEPPNLLVLDECESIFEQFGSGLHRNQHANFNIFKWMLTNAEYVVCMDANISQRTICILRKMRGKPIHFHKNNYKVAKDDQYLFTRDAGAWLHMLDASILKGERVVLPMNINKRAEAVFEFLQARYSGNFIDDTYGSNMPFPAKRIGLYNSKTLPSVKKAHFSDVNNTWSNYDVLIYTPTVTAGVSFEKAHYDRMFGWFSDQSCAAETCMQMMGRIRNIKNKQCIIYADFRHMFFPISVEEIREAVDKNRYLLLKDEANMFSFEYDKDCNIVRHNSDYFWLWIENERIKNLSRNTFLRRLIAIIQQAGAKVGHYSECYNAITGVNRESSKSNNICELLLGCVNVTKESINAREIRNIARAEEISNEEYQEIEVLKNQQLDVTPDQRYCHKKYKLRCDYNNFQGQINENFVATYLPYKVKQIFANLRRIQGVTDFGEVYKVMREMASAGYVSAMETDPNKSNAQMLDLNIKSVFNYHRCALKCLTMMGFKSFNDPRRTVIEVVFAAKPHLAKIYELVREDIRTNGGNVVPICSSDPNNQPMSFLGELCKIVNPILRRTYAAEIIIDKDLGSVSINKSSLFDETGTSQTKPSLR